MKISTLVSCLERKVGGLFGVRLAEGGGCLLSWFCIRVRVPGILVCSKLCRTQIKFT